MPAVNRLFDEGTCRGNRWLRELGDEFRQARLRLGLTQLEVATAARIDRADYSRIEAGKLPRLAVLAACRIGAVLGLDVTARAFPGGPGIRDAGQTPRLLKLIACIGQPLRYRAEVVLPSLDGRREQRAWDLMIFGHGERTGIDFEARLYDFQAQLRRLRLKSRDDPVDHLLLVVANTAANRRALAEFGELMSDIPRLRTEDVLNGLRGGRHPPTGLILLDAPVPRKRPAAGGPVAPRHEQEPSAARAREIRAKRAARSQSVAR